MTKVVKLSMVKLCADPSWFRDHRIYKPWVRKQGFCCWVGRVTKPHASSSDWNCCNASLKSVSIFIAVSNVGLWDFIAKIVSLIYFVCNHLHYNILEVEHTLYFTHCSCEALPITLARAELWPATPVSPCFWFFWSSWLGRGTNARESSFPQRCSTLEFRCPYQAGKVRESCYNYYEDIVTCTCI